MSARGAFAALLVLLVLAPTAHAAGGRCSIGTSAYLTEGPTDHSQFLAARGTVKAAMIFVDFSDAPASEDPSVLYDAFAPPASAFYAASSYGAMTLRVRPLLTWLRMPKPSTAYGFADRSVSAHQQLVYMREALKLADPQMDFSGTDEFYVVSSAGAAIPYSPALVAGPAASRLKADGTRMGFGATFGNDIREAFDGNPYEWAPWILEHETGHTLGLPDLYRLGEGLDNLHPDVGVWDTMGDLYRGTSFMAWQRRKLGWLARRQVTCLRKPGTRSATLAPLDRPAGTKLLVVRLDHQRAYSVEVRRPVGTDAGLCGAGVLIALIDGRHHTGHSPIVVQRAAQAPDGVDFDCGQTANAAFAAGGTFEHGRVSVSVLGARGDGYRVSATLRRAG